MQLSETLQQFIVRHINSDDQLEMLLLLREEPAKDWMADEIARRLFTQAETVQQRLRQLMMGYAVAGLFFFKFFRQTRDRLFALFAAAFWLLALNYLLLTPTQQSDEALPLHYMVRFVAFFIILLGILDKNYSKRKR